MTKVRLDVAVFENGLVESREKARALIMEGKIYVNGQKLDKPGISVASDAKFEIAGEGCPYVSRGGLKLQKALDEFGVAVVNATALDIGSSTGGFTDCLLKHGAKKIYAVDSGTAQLDYKLRTDNRVIVLEKTNFRYLEYAEINERIDIAVMDVSFISVLKLADNLKKFLEIDSEIIILIKPQFEAQRHQASFKGVIRDKGMHLSIIENVIYNMSEKKYYLRDLTYSPVKGPKGNIEFLARFSLSDAYKNESFDSKMKECVEEAHRFLK